MNDQEEGAAFLPLAVFDCVFCERGSDKGAGVQAKVNGADDVNGSDAKPFESSSESSVVLVKASSKNVEVFWVIDL